MWCRESREAGRLHTEHQHHSSKSQQIGSAEPSILPTPYRQGAEQGEQDVERQEWLPPKAQELRYICGWYSIVAPVVGLPLPLGLYSNHMQQDAAQHGMASPPCNTSMLPEQCHVCS